PRLSQNSAAESCRMALRLCVSTACLWMSSPPAIRSAPGRRVARASRRADRRPERLPLVMRLLPVVRNHNHAVRRVEDRLVLLIPLDAEVLVAGPPEQLNDLTAPRRLAVNTARLDPVANTGPGCCLGSHHPLL